MTRPSAVQHNPRCSLTLRRNGLIFCLSTASVDGQIAETRWLLHPKDVEGFRGLSYEALKEFLESQPEQHAIVDIEDGRVQPAPRDER